MRIIVASQPDSPAFSDLTGDGFSPSGSDTELIEVNDEVEK